MKILSSLLVASVVMLLTGCVSTVDGHSKAGVPLIKDRIVSRYERTVPQLMTAAREVLVRNGKILADNTVGNSFAAKVNECNVWVKMAEVDPKVTEVTVQVRTKTGGTNIDLASEISKQIALELATRR